MRVDDFDFDLPEENIALRPAVPRDKARMLVVNADAPGSLHDSDVGNLPMHLRPGDALVFNDTKVIPAQLEGFRKRGEAMAKIGATMHLRTSPNRWRAFVRGSKKLKIGDNVEFEGTGETPLQSRVVDKNEGGEVEFEFEIGGRALDARFEEIGHIPLPPYIASKRAEDKRDHIDYQTVYARKDGAVAAPTAGLHFTDQLFAELDAKGVSQHYVTLHVGAGTFLPVKVDDTDDHKMHSEIGYISDETASLLNEVKANGGRVISVGTTSMRLLESAAMVDGTLSAWSGETDIFITPGYNFRFVDALMTNFHLPRSTLFMLVSAFAGTVEMRAAYAHAIENQYRFYSYGDSSLLFPAR